MEKHGRYIICDFVTGYSSITEETTPNNSVSVAGLWVQILNPGRPEHEGDANYSPATFGCLLTIQMRSLD